MSFDKIFDLTAGVYFFYTVLVIRHPERVSLVGQYL